MLVSSAIPTHRIVVEKVAREDFDELNNVFTKSNAEISHSRAPTVIVGAESRRNIQVFKIFDENDSLVAYFPFEETRFVNIRIIRPALYELTLDFIDLSALPSWRSHATTIFVDWINDQKNTVCELFMCDENSTLSQCALENNRFHVESRGKYFYLNLPTTFEEFLNGLSASTRKSTKRVLKKFSQSMRFEVVEPPAYGDEIHNAIADLIRLHKNIFPSNSAMLPHIDALTRYIQNGFSEKVVFFTRAREVDSGQIVATELFVASHDFFGLVNNGRRTESEYKDVGTWVLLKTIEWAIESGKTRCEFLFGDQEYKRRLSTGVHDAVSITYFSSSRARILFRIRQRLGRKITSLR